MQRMTAWARFLVIAIVVAETYWVADHFHYAMKSATSRAATITPNFIFDNGVGENLPPKERSLFDQLTLDGGAGQQIPFPFSKLLQSLSKAGGCRLDDGRACFQSVLIPLGRSLQRTAAAPDFFKFPRHVVAFTGEPSGRENFPLFKDRLYLGYQEKARLIEVISFNETAGRFEFQLVKNYDANSMPRVVYANRFVCSSCHQNQTPIFSRQVWDETNANPAIAKRLAEPRKAFDGAPVRIGIDVPNALDDSTDRANLLPAYNLLWREGCKGNRRCRAHALTAALQYRLTGERGFYYGSTNFQKEFLAVFAKNWLRNWPDGIKIPSNDIPNRDPLQFANSERLAHVPARFEALLPRGHKEIWQWETDRFRLIKGIGEFFSSEDIRAIASKIGYSNASTKSLDQVLRDPAFANLDRAIQAMNQAALNDDSIRHSLLRDAVFQALGIDPGKRCCDDQSSPQPQSDDIATSTSANGEMGLNLFYVHCARCHATQEPFPPNFLSGDAAQVTKKLRNCADRIFFRLGMWQLSPSARPKTPMPPEAMLPMQSEQWFASESVAQMRKYVLPYVNAELKKQPDAWLGLSYESLPRCTLH